MRTPAAVVMALLAAAAPGQSLRLLQVPTPGPGLPVLQGGGLPVPPGTGITAGTDLRVTGPSGEAVPADIRILAGGPDGEARWIHVAVTSQGNADGDKPLVLSLRSKDAPPAGPEMHLDNEEGRVDAGCLKVHLGSGDPVLVKGVERDGSRLPLGLKLRLVGPDGRSRTFAPGSHVVEHRGRVFTRLRWRGDLGEGLAATVRLTVVRKSPVLLLEVRLENPGPVGLFPGIPDGTHYLDALTVELETPGGGSQPAAGWDGAAWRDLPLVVDLPEIRRPARDRHRNLVYRSRGPGETREGLGHPGVVALRSGGQELWVGRPHARFEAPARFTLRAGSCAVHLLPEGGCGPRYRGRYGIPGKRGEVDPSSLEHYRLEGGRWKTFRLGLMPRAASPGAARVTASLQNALEHPPALIPEPPYVPRIAGPGFLMAPFSEDPDPGLARYQRMLRILVDDSQATPLQGLGRIGLPAFLRRGGTYGGVHPYGWFDFGDIPWAEGWCSLHYDLPRTLLAGYLAGGDRRFLDRGCTMARHQRDVDTVHSAPGARYRGAQRYEKGWWHGNAFPPAPSHQWITGLFLHHVLTGDPGSLEALHQSGDYLLSLGAPSWSGLYGARMVGWPLDNLVTLWLLDGDKRWLREGRGIIRRFQELEAGFGGAGYVLNRAHRDPDRGRPARMQSWMHAIFLASCCRWVLQTGDRSPLPLIRRMAVHLVEHTYIPPRREKGRGFVPARVYEFWAPDGHRKNPSVHLTWVLLDGLAHAALVLEDRELARTCGEIFHGLTRFHQWGPGSGPADPENPATWSPISARLTMFPGSESKILSNIGRFGMSWPAVSCRLSR